MMVEGGQAEGGDGVQQTKEMRTEINGGSAQDPANFEVRCQTKITSLGGDFRKQVEEFYAPYVLCLSYEVMLRVLRKSYKNAKKELRES